MAMTWGYVNYRKKTIREATDLILERTKDREKFYTLAIKMLTVAQERGLRLIMENPWSMQTYLKSNFILPPTLIDHNRSLRGDYFKKETAYWYINCEPTHGRSYQQAKEKKSILKCKSSQKAGLCSEERSMISSDYARNFICDFILGKEQAHTERSLFDD